MSISSVRAHLEKFGAGDRIIEFDTSSATVSLAAAALGTEEARIAKSIAVYGKEENSCIIVVTAGDYKLNNAKFKAKFGFKPKMLSSEDTLRLTGHPVGGVCPFALPEGVRVYLDESLLRFPDIYPAAGSSNSAVRLTCDELFRFSGALSYADLCAPKE